MPDRTNPGRGSGFFACPTRREPMKILIADDPTLFRNSLGGLLTSRGFEIVGEAIGLSGRGPVRGPYLRCSR
jgi:hypothetical protein